MTDTIYDQVLDAVQTTIQALSLTRVASADVVVRKLPTDGQFMHHGITISPDYERMDDSEPTEGTTEREMVGYPCVITMVDGTGRGWGDAIPAMTVWRQKIRRTFHNKRLTGVTETGTNHVICKVTHGRAFDPKKYGENLDVSQLVIWAWYLETRTA